MLSKESIKAIEPPRQKVFYDSSMSPIKSHSVLPKIYSATMNNEHSATSRPKRRGYISNIVLIDDDVCRKRRETYLEKHSERCPTLSRKSLEFNSVISNNTPLKKDRQVHEHDNMLKDYESSTNQTTEQSGCSTPSLEHRDSKEGAFLTSSPVDTDKVKVYQPIPNSLLARSASVTLNAEHLLSTNSSKAIKLPPQIPSQAKKKSIIAVGLASLDHLDERQQEKRRILREEKAMQDSENEEWERFLESLKPVPINPKEELNKIIAVSTTSALSFYKWKLNL
jgi:hypothetical protein